MSLKPIVKECSKCKKMYSWNPSVGKLDCPHCGGMGRNVVEAIYRVRDSKNKNKEV